jgi:hypothetical protein
MVQAEAFGIIILAAIVLSLVVIAINTALLRSMLRKVLFPEGVPQILKACPHCYRQMPARAVVCASCHRESEPWTFRDGYWWRTSESGKPEYLDAQARRWVLPPSKT